MTNFYAFGPFRLKSTKKHISNSSRADFQEALENDYEGLSKAVGCYVFTIKAGRGERPWYIGKTERMDFVRECYSPSKLNLFNEILAARKKGIPRLFLYAKITPTQRFAKAKQKQNKHHEVAFLETLLIGVAIRRNPKLLNRQKTRHLKTICVPGFVNSKQGKPSAAAASLARILGTASR